MSASNQGETLMILEPKSKKREAQLTPLQNKVEQMRKSLEEIQKYELLTTNQYLLQMELIVEILQAISVRDDTRTGLKKATPARIGAGHD